MGEPVLGQVVGGAGSGASLALGWWKGKLFPAYGSSNKVVVLDERLKTVQIIIIHEEQLVNALDWCPSTGKLAIACESNIIYIYSPTENPKTNEVIWERKGEIKHDFRVSSISWRPTGDCVLVSGTSIALWKLNEVEKINEEDTRRVPEKKIILEPSLMWRSSVSVPIKISSFASDGRYFATVGEFDRLVKIWYRYNQDRFGFVYLPHPRSIVNLIWKKKSDFKRGEDNILLTVCRSNIIRLWVETGHSERFQFTVCAVIEPGVATTVDWLNLSSSVLDPSYTKDVEKEFHDIKEDHASKIKMSRHTKITTTHNSSLDWIVGVQKSGMVIIWKVKGLTDQPKHTPNFSIWSRFSITPTQGGAAHYKLISLCNAFSQDNRHSPVKFKMYILSSSGAINCWECIEEGNINPRIMPSLVSTSSGHKSVINDIYVHPNLPLIASADQGQRCILWKSDAKQWAELPFILNNITSFDNTVIFSWTPVERFLMTSNSRGVFVYETELLNADYKQKPPNSLMGLLADSDQFSPLMFLHAFAFDAAKPYELKVGGVSDNGNTIVLWSLDLPQATEEKSSKKGSLQAGEFLGSYKLTEGSITSVTATHKYFVADGKIPPFSIITGGSDGYLRLWKLMADTDSKIQEVVAFKLGDEPIIQLRAGSHGLLTSVSKSGKEINVWQFELSSTISLNLKHTIKIEGSPGKFCCDWLNLNDGGAALAISHYNKVKILSQTPKSELRAFKVNWEERDLCALPFEIQSLAWMEDGTLLCSASNQIFVYTKWLRNSPEVPTLFHYFTHNFKPLPYYHPKVLMEYLVAGNFKLLGNILKGLSEKLDEIDRTRPLTLESLEKLIPQEEVKPKKKEEDEDPYGFLNTSSKIEVEEEEKKEESQTVTFASSGARRLAETLTQVQLPRVQGIEQMYLLAIIDTFAQMQDTQGAIDTMGGKYLLAYKMFSFLKRSMPPNERPTSLTSQDFAWALHSEAEDTLLQTCFPSDGNWALAKSLGVGIWVKKPTTLKSLVEKIAKNQFTASKDPHDCALFYIALNKKPALVALFKAVKNMPVHDFMKNDFTTDKWKTAALKNAYALLGKQRFELCAAFFLLGGQLKDCVDICLRKLGDYQLALTVARCVEGDIGPISTYILKDHVIPQALQSGDTPLASIANWLLKRYNDSVTVLLSSPSQTQTSDSDTTSNNSVKEPNRLTPEQDKFDPAFLHYLEYLKSHPMMRETTLKFEEITFDLVKKATIAYIDSGYGFLAIDQAKWLISNLEKLNKPAASSSSSLGGGFGFRMFRNPLMTLTTSTPKETKSVDKPLFLRLALQLLTEQISDSLNENYKPTKQEEKPILKENLEFLSKTLQVDQHQLLEDTLSFCEQRFFLIPQYELLWGEPDYQLNLLWRYACHLLSVGSPVSPPTTLGEHHLKQILNITKQLYRCFIPENAKSDLQLLEINSSIEYGFYLCAWKLKYYNTMLRVLSGKPLKQVIEAWDDDKKHNETLAAYEEVEEGAPAGVKTIALGETSHLELDRDTEIYIDKLFNLFTIRRLCNLYTQRNQKINANKIADLCTWMSRWRAEAQSQILVIPDAFSKLMKTTPGAHNEAQVFISTINAFVKKTKLKSNSTYLALWDFLVQEDTLSSFINDIPFNLEYTPTPTLSADGLPDLKFVETATLYRDKDILQAFCVNPMDPLQIAMATTHGIREIALNKDGQLVFADESDESGSSSESDYDSPKGKKEPLNFLSSSLRKGKIVSPALAKQSDRGVVAQWLEPHPNYPYYLSGGIDGSICLWQFFSPKDAVMAKYREPGGPRINKMHFNSRGTKFGACDMSGKLSLYRFDANEAFHKPIRTIQSNSKRTLDFTFLNSGSLIATAGVSNDKRSVCIWDTLMPPEKSQVISFYCHESGASSIIYSPRHQLLIVGGKKGDISLFDVRVNKELSNVKAHSLNVKTLALDPQEDFIISGSNEGNVKAWDLPTMKYRESWEDIHMKHTFVRKPGVFTAPVSTFGVMEVALDTQYMYTCGSDGRLLRTRYIRT